MQVNYRWTGKFMGQTVIDPHLFFKGRIRGIAPPGFRFRQKSGDGKQEGVDSEACPLIAASECIHDPLSPSALHARHRHGVGLFVIVVAE